ncbi:MAG: hypothetical protein EOP83_33280, partial [Verrucomicrobiaceae bacterium]
NMASASRIATNLATDVGIVAGSLTGSGALEKTGAGRLVLAGDSSGYTRPVTVSAGTLKLTGALGGNVLVSDSAAIAGEGSIAGDLTLGSSVVSDLHVDGSTPGALSTTNLTVNGTTYVRLTDLPAVAGTPIKLIDYSGTLTLQGALADAFQLENGFDYRGAPTFADTGSAITMVVPAGANLVWRGTNASEPSLWDVNYTTNWKNGANDADVFFNGDNVTFDDTGVTKTVLMGSLRSPGTVTFNNSAGNDYLISPNGAFGFTGATSIVKNGDGIATLQGNGHTYTGTVTINAGVLQPDGNQEMLGRASKVTVNDGGQLNLNGMNLGNGMRHYDVTIAGTGANGMGAITNTFPTGSIGSNAGLLHLTLSADASVGGNGSRFDFGRSGNSEGTITGNGFTLTKV